MGETNTACGNIILINTLYESLAVLREGNVNSELKLNNVGRLRVERAEHEPSKVQGVKLNLPHQHEKNVYN